MKCVHWRNITNVFEMFQVIFPLFLVKIQPHITSHCLASTTPELAVVQEIMIKVSSLLRRLVLLSTALMHFLDSVSVFQDKIVIDEIF